MTLKFLLFQSIFIAELEKRKNTSNGINKLHINGLYIYTSLNHAILYEWFSLWGYP